MTTRAPSPKPLWWPTCDLFYGGVRIGRVFSFARRTGAVEMLVMFGEFGTYRKESVKKITGRRRTGPNREMSNAEVCAELECRAGSAFGKYPVAQVVAQKIAPTKEGISDAA